MLWALAWSSGAHGTAIRVVAGVEIRVEPRLRPDRSALDVVLRVVDDHSAAASGDVVLRATSGPDASSGPFERRGSLDDRGAVAFVVPIEPARLGPLQLHAAFLGNDRTAQAETDARVDLDAPFITLGLRVPGSVDLGADRVDALVEVVVGEVVPLSPGGLEVGLRVDDRIVATATAEPTGRAVLRVPRSALATPGVRTLRAELQRAGDLVASPNRRIVVRAATTLALARTEGGGRVGLAGALATAAGPVPNAAVQIYWNQQSLGASLTQGDGTFALSVEPEVLAQADVVVRAVFSPSEPWYVGAESRPVRLTEPRGAKIPWTWVLSPVAVAGAIVALVLLRRRGREVVVEPPRPLGDATIERISHAPSTGTKIRLKVFDLATDAAVDGATATWTSPPLGTLPVAREVDVRVGIELQVEIVAKGYAPRRAKGRVDREGVYVLRVGIRSWREELFDRLRSWLSRTPVADRALPTPREALSRGANTPDARAAVEFIEAGSYGAREPDAEDVRQAENLTTKIDDRPAQGSVDAPN